MLSIIKALLVILSVVLTLKVSATKNEPLCQRMLVPRQSVRYILSRRLYRRNQQILFVFAPLQCPPRLLWRGLSCYKPGTSVVRLRGGGGEACEHKRTRIHVTNY